MEENKKNEMPIEQQSVRKKSFGKRTNVFLQSSANNIGNYILKDVLIPAGKKAISDIVTNGIYMLLYGESKPPEKRRTIDRPSYRSYYERDERKVETRSSRKSFLDYDIEFKTYEAAKSTLDDMRDALERFGTVSVADLCEFAQENDKDIRLDGSWADHKYGWMKLPREVKIYPSYGNYIIDLPAPMPLD